MASGVNEEVVWSKNIEELSSSSAEDGAVNRETRLAPISDFYDEGAARLLGLVLPTSEDGSSEGSSKPTQSQITTLVSRNVGASAQLSVLAQQIDVLQQQ